MKVISPLTALAVAATLTVAGCGGGSPSGGSSADSGSARAAANAPEPADGVPAGTRPLPLPVKGKAYNNPQPRDNIRDGGTLTLPIRELGPNFNNFSADGSTVYVQNILAWMSPNLWDFGVAGGASPNPDYLLSAELISEDPETVKYTLNPRARWNDGTPIDWTAFDATWKTQRGDDPRYNPAATDGFRSIASVRKGEKDNEVIVTFKEPYYPYESVFAVPSLEHPKNADPAFYKTGWANKINADLLAGPFTLESQSDDRIVLVRNPKWWGDPPKLDRVVYRLMDDVATVNAFQNGEVDTTTIDGGRATADLLRQIAGMKDVQIRRGFTPAATLYQLGQDSELFKDPAARKAFVLATDRRLIVEIRYQGMDWQEDAPGSALIYPWQDGYRDNIADLHYDPERARRVLDEAGWKLGEDGYRRKDGRLAEFTYVTFGDNPVFLAMARAQQKMVQDVGLKMNIDARKGSDFSKTLHDRSFDVLGMSWQSFLPFGYTNACQIYCTDSESNYSRVGSKHIDDLLKRVTTFKDPQQEFDAVNAAESEALHLFGLFPLYSGPSQFAVKKGLANFGPAGFLTVDPEDVGWQK
jgi:peptide/nickel transport system substrate-binding protein